MALLSLTKDGTGFYLDENNIIQVYSLSSQTKVQYADVDAGIVKNISVDESVATIGVSSNLLIALTETESGATFYLNSEKISSVLTEGTGSLIYFDALGKKMEVIVDETKAAVEALFPVTSTTNVKTYKALISQNAPIASRTSGTFNVGMIVSITTYVAGDDFSNWNLISGSENTTNAVYQVTVAAPTTWTNSSDLAYDGRPYVVSTDSNGDLNPLINTLNITPVFAYASAGVYTLTSVGSFTNGKTTIDYPRGLYNFIGDLPIFSGQMGILRYDEDTIVIQSLNESSGVAEDNILSSLTNLNWWIKIEVYP